MKFTHKLIFLFLGVHTILTAQTNNPLFNILDVQHYNLSIEVNDTNDNIDATMNISVKFKQNPTQFYFDLVKKDSTGKGMQIEYILQNNDTIQFNHVVNKINIKPQLINTDSIFNYKIKYNGVPKDGLIIEKNLYGDRTFFGDNWPNRAQNWFPCVDHPSDKATIEYIIKAPNYYQTIANGFEIEETNLENNLKMSHWKTEVPLPTKVMVIGIAKFAVQNIGETHNIPVSTWVYPQTKEQGFYDFEVAKEIVNFYIENVGEYPFLKLANVQSKTRFGGMENAGNIFYFEKSVNGKQNHKDLIAHEIAHQWFGNSASEIDWPHIWLSEGFATYFTDLYILKSDGEEAFKQRILEERNTVLNFYKTIQKPVIDKNTTNYMSLLNPNSYQKGAWFLHMLRLKIGDDNFWKGIQKYYNTYKLSNASTSNFKTIIAEVSKKDLDKFFFQWLEKPGHPILKTSWLYGNNKLRLIVEQTQNYIFQFPLDIEVFYNDGTSEIKTINITDKMAPYGIDTKGEVTSIKLDPNISLLFEEIKE